MLKYENSGLVTIWSSGGGGWSGCGRYVCSIPDGSIGLKDAPTVIRRLMRPEREGGQPGRPAERGPARPIAPGAGARIGLVGEVQEELAVGREIALAATRCARAATGRGQKCRAGCPSGSLRPTGWGHGAKGRRPARPGPATPPGGRGASASSSGARQYARPVSSVSQSPRAAMPRAGRSRAIGRLPRMPCQCNRCGRLPCYDLTRFCRAGPAPRLPAPTPIDRSLRACLQQDGARIGNSNSPPEPVDGFLPPRDGRCCAARWDCGPCGEAGAAAAPRASPVGRGVQRADRGQAPRAGRPGCAAGPSSP